ncbi:hypothetical protein [Thiomicrospira sp. S5]|jgi:hypothetical protein|uniref:hypothetical protein n=1 Tax=Thiomicrospira sp. S5 TaxID=1803865 RepID=UPI000F8A0CB8|nr:hypothetical protein [Thiomicrospira sp. S5]AZR82488.1 hypothetical protein AYJ59_09465 [Thiomicrospira sp. S5]
MQEFISLYNEHKPEIEKFLVETICNNAQLMSLETKGAQQFYTIFSCLELIYIADSEYIQTSPNIYKNKQSDAAIGKNRSYLVSHVDHEEQGVSVTSPYISSATGESCVTVIVSANGRFFFFDFNVVSLLMRLGLLELHPVFNKVTKSFYLAIGLSLMFFSIMSIGYAFYDYFLQWRHPDTYTLESVFKPIVALTMGLAIFDLAKTLLEREVFFKAYSDKKDESRLLSKFLIAIIIALSIEALMVVFKIALNDPTLMLHALYLIIGIALIILSLAFYSHWVKKAPGKQN